MKFITPSALSRLGVLGMNARNIDYIAGYNKRSLYSIVDNKLLTKKAAQSAGITVPELLGTIESQWQLRKLGQLLEPHSQFVIKPTRGSGGKGIFVINSRKKDIFIKPSGREYRLNDIHRHVNNILSGLYSLGGKPDYAMIEAMINYDPVFDNYTYEGVPDIRIIVFLGFPVMAMLRCATHSSDGRANLHQGAIGVGISLSTGQTLFAVQRNRRIERHPDTDKPFADLCIPHWQQVLELAAGCYEMTSLGYLGCDMILDRNKGPMILELNARPGLAIQMACAAGLKKRLEAIENMEPEERSMSPAERVHYIQNVF